MTEDVRRIAAWCCANSLLINPDKTKLLLLGTRQMLRKIPDDIHVTLLSKKIYPVSSAKDLEITIDASLTYDEHVTNLVSSCATSLCQINRIDLFGLYILFSQYRSCDNTQEAWSFVLFIKKSACRHIALILMRRTHLRET